MARTTVKPRPRHKDAVERLKGEIVAPVKTLQLMDILNVSRTARELGVSTTTLHKAKKSNMVSRVIEVAAEGKLREITQQATGESGGHSAPATMQRGQTEVFLLEVDRSKRDMVVKFAEMMGGKLIAA